MKHCHPRRVRSAARDRGFALIAFLLLVVMVSAYVIANAITHTNSELAQSRADRTMNSLRQAKVALITYAASEQWQLSLGQVIKQPGALPCPDKDDTGTSPGACDPAAKRVGRLPWRTIGTDDLRDASGERLWYAVSSTFRKDSLATVINSDTLGLLTVTGSAPATNVVAIVFAPGARIQNQVRPSNTTAPEHNDPANYLESFLASGSDYTYTTSALPSDTFNDRLLAVTQAELMAAVEPVVAARIQRDIQPVIQSYYSGWQNSGYPFPAPFSTGGGPGRAQVQYTGGAPGTTRGLLPITNDPDFLTWQTNSIVVTQIPGGTGSGTSGSPTINNVTCSASTTNQISCRIDYSGSSDDRPAVRLQAVLQNAAKSFPAPLQFIDAKMTDKNGDPLTFTKDYGNWSPVGPPDYPTFFVPTTNNTLLANGDGQVVFTGRLQNPGSPPDGTGGRVTISINVPSYLSVTDPANATTGWFILNQWYRQTYFAVSPGYLPGGGSACSPLPAMPSCLTVNNLRPVAPASCTPLVPSTDPCSAINKRALLILAGRALNGSTRPSSNPKDYLEGENCNLAAGKDLDIGSMPSTCNLTTSDFVYEHRAGTPTTINDRIVVVAP